MMHGQKNIKIFQTKAAEKIKANGLFSMAIFRTSCRLWDNMEKHGRSGQATDGNI